MTREEYKELFKVDENGVFINLIIPKDEFGEELNLIGKLPEDFTLEEIIRMKKYSQKMFKEIKMDNICIRPLQVNEIRECLELFTDRYSEQTLEDYPELVDTFKQNSLESLSDICEAVEYGVMFGNVAVIEDEIVGFILVTAPNYIRKIAVKKEYQKLGIAKRLVESIEDTNSELTVHAAEKVISFYEKLGFIKDGDMNRDKYPYLPMKKILKK